METSLVVQWLKIHLAMQGMQVPSFIWELRPPHAMGQLSLHIQLENLGTLQLERARPLPQGAQCSHKNLIKKISQ